MKLTDNTGSLLSAYFTVNILLNRDSKSFMGYLSLFVSLTLIRYFINSAESDTHFLVYICVFRSKHYETVTHKAQGRYWSLFVSFSIQTKYLLTETDEPTPFCTINSFLHSKYRTKLLIKKVRGLLITGRFISHSNKTFISWNPRVSNILLQSVRFSFQNTLRNCYLRSFVGRQSLFVLLTFIFNNE